MAKFVTKGAEAKQTDSITPSQPLSDSTDINAKSNPLHDYLSDRIGTWGMKIVLTVTNYFWGIMAIIVVLKM